MDWSNEIYVRLYTRETDDDLALSWEALALWRAMLTKFDRSGFIATKRGARGLAAVVRIPADVVARALPELLDDRRVFEVARSPIGPGYYAPNFVAAQEASKSDKQRQRESRIRRSTQTLDGDITIRDGEITIRDQNVTSGHIASQPVTLSLAEHSEAEPSGSRARAPAHDPPSTEYEEASEVVPEPVAQIATTPGPDFAWRKLENDLWNAGRERYRELHADGVDASATLGAWNGLPNKLLVARLRDMRERGLTVEQARERGMNAIATGAARAQNASSLQFFTPAWFLDDKHFDRDADTSPAQVSRPRAGPRSPPPEQPVRRINRL